MSTYDDDADRWGDGDEEPPALRSLKPGVVHQCPIPDPFDVVPG